MDTLVNYEMALHIKICAPKEIEEETLFNEIEDVEKPYLYALCDGCRASRGLLLKDVRSCNFQYGLWRKWPMAQGRYECRCAL